MAANDFQQQCMNPARFGRVGSLHVDIDAPELVAMGPVANIAVDKRRIRHDDRLLLEGFHFGRTHADLLDDAADRASFHPVADLKGTLGEQNETGNKVLYDVLQAKTDAERETAGNKGEVRHVEPGCRYPHQGRQTETDIAYDCADRIAYAGIDAPARHDTVVQPVLEPARQQIADHEQQHAGQEPHERDRNITDLETRHQLVESTFQFSPLEAKLHQDERNADQRHDEIDQDAGCEAKLIQRRVVEMKALPHCLADMAGSKSLLLGNRASGQEAHIHGHEKSACHNDLLRDK